jgi:hypothetical protein
MRSALRSPFRLPLEAAVGAAVNPSRGPELIVNGDFSQGATGWNLGAGWSIAGKLIATAAAANSTTFSAGTVFTLGKFYDVSITSDSFTGGSWKLLTEGGANIVGDQSTAGTFRATVQAPATGSIYVWANAILDASFTKISVREILQY